MIYLRHVTAISAAATVPIGQNIFYEKTLTARGDADAVFGSKSRVLWNR